jgi:hypothetical protein
MNLTLGHASCDVFTEITTMFSKIQTTFLTFFPPKKIVFILLELVFTRMVVKKKHFGWVSY